MRAGERQALIRVMKPGQGENSHGEASPEWVLHTEVWARLFPLRGYERNAGNERQAIAVYRCQLDYLEAEGITSAMRVDFEGLTFNIISVHHDFVDRRTTDLQLGETTRGA